MKHSVLFSALSLFVLSSCRENNSSEQFKAIVVSLENSNNMLRDKNLAIYYDLTYKLEDPQTKRAAAIWQPRVVEVKNLSESLLVYIDGLKAALKKAAGLKIKDGKEIFAESDDNAVRLVMETNGKAADLYKAISDYRVSILHTFRTDELQYNPRLCEQIERGMHLLNKEFPLDVGRDSLFDKESWNKHYFEHTTAIGGLAMLTKLQGDILTTQSIVTDYFNLQGVYYSDSFNVCSAIVTQNSNYFKSGQTLEISAGVGLFSTIAQPIITCNGNKVRIREDGVAVYNLVVNGPPGQYHIPVSVEYFKSDGTKKIMTKSIEYNIAP